MSNSEKETWNNVGRGDIYIRTFDHTGKLGTTVVRAGRSAVVTVEERRINQERAYNANSDIFKNGSLIPVHLVDSAEDFHEIANNPNHLSEDDMKAMFKLKGVDFKKKLSEISNSTAISRMQEIADSDEVGVTMTQFKALEHRSSELNGNSDIMEIENSSTEGPLPR